MMNLKRKNVLTRRSQNLVPTEILLGYSLGDPGNLIYLLPESGIVSEARLSYYRTGKVKKNPRIIVAGGGASGILAAGQAALQGANVLLLEKKNRVGNKLLISGKGRCNVTNTAELNDFLQNFNREGRFLRQSFNHFFTRELMQFFSQLGINLVTERGGRVFPASGQASEIVIALERWLTHCGVQIRYNSPVTGLVVKHGQVKGVVCGRKTIMGDRVILAMGGATYPATGSSGDGYRLLEEYGHTITALRPALVPLRLKTKGLSRLAGLDLRNVGFRVFFDGKRRIVDFGEVSFTPTSIGGPLTLTHSLVIGDAIAIGKKVEIALDLKPALDEQKLDKRLSRDLQERRKEECISGLRGLLPKQLIEVALAGCGISSAKICGEVDAHERRRLRQWLKNFRFTVAGPKPMKEAIVTAGGVNVKEIDPNTMESKKIGNLYITGELLNVHGNTGGFNLQAAFSTGWLAGRSAGQDSLVPL